MNPAKTCEIHGAPIDDRAGSRLADKIVEHIDIMDFAAGNAGYSGDVAPKVQRGVKLHRCFVFAELGPRKHRKKEIDGRRDAEDC